MAGKKKKAGLLKIGLLAGLLAGVACIFKALAGKKKKKEPKLAQKKSGKKKKV